MIKADHKYWARVLYDFYIKRQFKSNFQNFYLTNDFPIIPKEDGLIVTPNHFSWWDGFFIDYTLNHFLNRKIFILMLEEQLERYWFFQKIGAFSINQKNPISIARTFQYISRIISNPLNYLVFYPQGDIETYDKRPLTVKEGLKVLSAKINFIVKIVPAAFKINYGNNKKPDVIVRFGKVIPLNDIKRDFTIFIHEFNSNIELLDKETSLNHKHKLLA